MKLNELKRSYSAIYSLGQNCYPSIHLRRLGLRPYAGFLDWNSSYNLSSVNRLLKNNFKDFLLFKNLSFTKYWADGKELGFRDTLYGIDSVHDFKSPPNTETSLPSYPEIKAKYDSRIKHFLKIAATSKSILFVRLGGTYDEIKELEEILEGKVKHRFYILFITDLWIPIDPMLKHTCIIQTPITTELCLEEDFWNNIFEGISIQST
ncbi:DUF1796 family putative cysteine peptidase [Bacillus cereus]|uniref:Papain-like cysteine peptidase n=1 Tax=Bacillus cereus TaxID=1396 RepID=A0AAW5L8D6_BACCE|nr:DUF1796 family putative cysteine peptidase [Bacillus cereus]MCQ6288445.1 papain-like cysteine peptidase [Bacillus cereus]MCQ6317579.1 papain-like cysteine peptidase [Bacillus cereus]MCQ6328553.1 papain-like cysteine peptidase [Bacillus cereus]MCQ6385548.1 papain-like cysteine peptidase [Bacillus cereus]